MNLWTFFLLQLKRIGKHTAFLLLLLLFPICLFFLSDAFHKEEDSRIPVGLCLATDDSFAEALCTKLIDKNDSLFTFSLVNSEEELLRGVQQKRYECGYLFQKELGKELDKNRGKNLITVYVSETTTCTGVLNELVYAELFEEYSLSLLQETLTDANHLPFTDKEAASFSLPAVDKDAIETAYRSHLTDGSTFRIEVSFLSGPDASPKSGTSVATLPILRGLSAAFLLLCGFLALLATVNDKANGLYDRLYGTARFLCPPLTMIAYLLPSGLSCLVGIALSRTGAAPGTELFAMLCYIGVLLLFYTVLGTLIRNHTVLCAVFPMLVLCTLVFTPVITDLSVFFPWIKAVRYVFPSYYYLLFF